MKRKASELEDGPQFGAWSPSSNYSASSSGSPSRYDFGSMMHTSKPHTLNRSHINTRTRKRFRDDRPDIDVIHHNTLAKLFGAQRQQFFLPPTILENDSTGEVPAPASIIEPTQKSLHSFFSISHTPVPKIGPRSSSINMSNGDALNKCDDCGNALDPSAGKSSGDCEMMDLDQEYECASCHRNVCDTCAVRGDERICLECAIPGGG